MKKPIAKLSGQDGNVFNLISIASKALKNRTPDLSLEMRKKVFKAGSYDEAIQIIAEYCEIR